MAKPKLALIPAAQGTSLYSVLPSSGVGDFDFTRSGSATRINAQGLIETVGSGVSRLNYPMIDGVVKGCPHHILEPERRQLVRYSEDFSQWVLIGSPTIELNNIISPDGILNGTQVTRGSNETPLRLQTSSILNSEHTFTVYAKKGNHDKLNLDIGDEENFTFTLTDDWQRFEITSTPTTYNHVDIALPFSSSGDFIYIYGAMLEQGSYPTSYIPNYGTAAGVTRSAETASGAGDASTFNNSEGVLMMEISALADDLTYRGISISNSTSQNQLLMEYEGVTNKFRAYIAVSNNVDGLISVTVDTTQNNKIAYKYAENNLALWINGVEVGSFTGTKAMLAANTMTNLKFARGNNTQPFYGNTKQIQYFDSALNDSDLEKLTSWVSFTDMAESQLYSIE